VGCKSVVAQPLEIPQHFVERRTGRGSRRTKQPCALGAAPAQKAVLFDPYQFAAHGFLSTPRDLLLLDFLERRLGFSSRPHCEETRRSFHRSARISAQVATD
jgi:hypothetical protein